MTNEQLDKYEKVINLWQVDFLSQKEISTSINLTRERVRQIIRDWTKEKILEKRLILNNRKEKIKIQRIKSPAYGLTGRDYTREIVRARDQWTCQNCKVVWKEGKMRFDVHHLDGLCGKKSTGYDSVKNLDRLVTLCHKCHYNHPEHTLKTRKNKYNS